MIKNDSRRYHPTKQIDSDMIPRMMKHDKYFGSIRKYILQKYNTQQRVRKEEKKPQQILKKLTQNPMNYYRALESEKDKEEFMKFMRRDAHDSLQKQQARTASLSKQIK